MMGRKKMDPPARKKRRTSHDQVEERGDRSPSPSHSIGSTAVDPSEASGDKRKRGSDEERDEEEQLQDEDRNEEGGDQEQGGDEEGGGDKAGDREGGDKGGGDADDESDARSAPKRQKVRKSAAERLADAAKRQGVRYKRQPWVKGQYQTPTGVIGLSKGQAGDAKVTSRKENFGEESFGSNPAYSDIGKNFHPEAESAVIGEGEAPKDMTNKQKLAAALATGLIRAEDVRAPGYQKYLRAMYRRHIKTKAQEDSPFTEENNPAIAKAENARELMGGTLTEKQIATIDEHMSDSSDEEKDDGIGRLKTLTLLDGADDDNEEDKQEKDRGEVKKDEDKKEGDGDGD